MISYRELTVAFRSAGLVAGKPVIVHSALSSLGDEIRGGPEALIGSLLSLGGLMVPTFTYKTMLIPEAGPENNAAAYGSGKDRNRMAEFFSAQMPADRMMGLFPETVRLRPEARRSLHPILSFAGIGLDAAIDSQSLADPFAPIRTLADQDGFVVLIGVDQRVNTSIHFGEVCAGRKQFVRWALTPDGVRECPGFPGCSEGFNQAALLFAPFTGRSRVGEAQIQVIPLKPMLEKVTAHLREDPLALLCGRADCERCAAVRDSLKYPAYISIEPY
jgi:aminoglycoside 3-N-acetyltransferase